MNLADRRSTAGPTITDAATQAIGLSVAGALQVATPVDGFPRVAVGEADPYVNRSILLRH